MGQRHTASNGIEIEFAVADHRPGVRYDIKQLISMSVWQRVNGFWVPHVTQANHPDDASNSDECVAAVPRLFTVDMPGFVEAVLPGNASITYWTVNGAPLDPMADSILWRGSLSTWVVASSGAGGYSRISADVPWHSVVSVSLTGSGMWDLRRSASEIGPGPLPGFNTPPTRAEAPRPSPGALAAVQRDLPPAHNLACDAPLRDIGGANRNNSGRGLNSEPDLPDDMGPFPNSFVPASGGDSIHAALESMRAGNRTDRMVLDELLSGRIRVRYIEDFAVIPNSNAVARQRGLNPSQWVIRLNRETGRQVPFQRNAVGARDGVWIYVSRRATVSAVRTVLVHETGHAVNRRGGPGGSISRYQDEFQAYWFAEFAGVPLAQRAMRIRNHLLRDYPALCRAYANSRGVAGGFAALVDATERPQQTLTGMVGREQLQATLASNPPDIEEAYRIIRGMTPEERAEVRADESFRGFVLRLGRSERQGVLSALSR